MPHRYNKIEKKREEVKKNHLEVYSCGEFNTPMLASGVLIVYHNRRKFTTMNPKGYPSAIYRELFETGLLKPAV